MKWRIGVSRREDDYGYNRVKPVPVFDERG